MSRERFPQEIIDEAQAEARQSDIKFAQEIAESEQQSAANRATAREVTQGSLRPARRQDYEAWLRSWVEAGNQPTHPYNYPFEQGNSSNAFEPHGKRWHVAEQDFSTVPLHGADSVCIIVPEGVQHVEGELGHTSLYFYKNPDPEQQGPHASGWVPSYNDLDVR